MNQLPSHVTMIRRHGTYAALRVRPNAGPEVRTARQGPWEPLPVKKVTRRLPWRIRTVLADGSVFAFSPCRPGEADMTRVAAKQPEPAGSNSLNDDPLSAVIGIFLILFYVILLPYGITVLVGRCRAAKQVQRELAAAIERSVASHA